ncbi:unnamed protein product [Phytophthora fragariaefolia]|uniref:Unnamed protein product n=1 Tax=Phytophthora fragariaefolia TaxID=1490495 RepID=A0A9W7CRS3_9STRA|nr:unnamed protein product [Phytophthora fragariaefolia]
MGNDLRRYYKERVYESWSSPHRPSSQTTPSEDAVVTHAQVNGREERGRSVDREKRRCAHVYFKNERGWKVSEAQVRFWWKQCTAIKAAQARRSRLSAAGAKPRLSEIEDILFDQVLFHRSAKEKVFRDWIRDAGQRLAASELGDADFVASDRWVNGFMRRYRLSLRRATNYTVLTDDVLTDRAVSFLSYLTSRIDGLSDDHTILMDETAVYFEDPRRHTVDQVGARHVMPTSKGFASMRVTAVLTITATGRKLPPLAVWKGAKQDDKLSATATSTS